jgi:alpha-beta hydrolase superfamily lysophospholipase
METIENTDLPKADGVVLISPEIGVSKAAALAIWQARLGRVLGMPKFAWSSVLPEYDPFKYNSFAINAGDQAHRLTTEIRDQMDAFAKSGDLQKLPPILALQSVVDATVSTPALVQILFDPLPKNGGHQLVIFDMNQLAGINPLLDMSARDHIATLLKRPDRNFTLTVVTNADLSSREVIARHMAPGDTRELRFPLNASWPEGVYSLSHIALPVPAHDPLYGSTPYDGGPQIRLGNITLRGERNALQINPTDLFRLRWNPFYNYLEKQVADFMELGA